MGDTDVIQKFIDWLRREGYFMKKVNALGNEAFVPTSELLEAYRLAGGFGRAQEEDTANGDVPMF
jgi:hypothetical protein